MGTLLIALHTGREMTTEWTEKKGLERSIGERTESDKGAVYKG